MQTVYWNLDTKIVSAQLNSRVPVQVRLKRGSEAVNVVLVQGTPPAPILLAAGVPVGIVVRDPLNLKMAPLAGPSVLVRGSAATVGYAGTTSTDTTRTHAVMHVDPTDSAVELPTYDARAAFYYVPADGGDEIESQPFLWTILPDYYRPGQPPTEVVLGYPTAAGLQAAVTKADAAEPGLGNPGANGGMLSSLSNGVRSWVAASTFGRSLLAMADASGLLRLLGLIKVFTPEMYGAVGDGVTDDTAAVNAAVNAILAQPNSTGVLRLTSSAYKVSSLNIGSSAGVSCISVRGKAKNGTKLIVTGAVGLNLINNKFSAFSDFWLVNANARGTTIGIQIGGTMPGNASQGCRFERIQLDGFSTLVHLSSNTGGSLAGYTGSELHFENITGTFADIGFLQDDFNSLNNIFVNCDIQNSGVGWDLRTGGCSLYDCSGEVNGVDVWYKNPTNGVLPVVISKFHSEAGGLPFILHGNCVVDGAELLTITPSLFSLAPLGAGTYDAPPAIMVIGLNAPNANQVKVTVRNSVMAGSIAMGYPADLKVENCIVKAAAIPIARNDFSGPKMGRYKIENCSLTTDGSLYNSTPYQDRWGVYDATSGDPVDSIRMNPDGTLVLKGTIAA